MTFIDMGNGTGGVIFSAIVYIIAGMLYTLVNIPYSSLAAVMTEDTGQRTLLGTSRTISMNVGMIIVNSCSAGLALHFSGNGAEVATGRIFPDPADYVANQEQTKEALKGINITVKQVRPDPLEIQEKD